MRPINLIPKEQRRSHGDVARTGPLAYLIVGALGVLLIGVVMLVLTSNQISDRRRGSDDGSKPEGGGDRAGRALAPYVELPTGRRSADETRRRPRRQPFRLGTGDPPAFADPATRTVYLTSLSGSAGGGEAAP